MSIYCLMNVGSSLTDEIAQLMFDTAQEIIQTKSRKSRVSLPSQRLTGEITTRYQMGMMGTVGGIVFKANIDWDNGSAKTDFLVKPIRSPDDIAGATWKSIPLFSCPVSQRDSN